MKRKTQAPKAYGKKHLEGNSELEKLIRKKKELKSIT